MINYRHASPPHAANVSRLLIFPYRAAAVLLMNVAFRSRFKMLSLPIRLIRLRQLQHTFINEMYLLQSRFTLIIFTGN